MKTSDRRNREYFFLAVNTGYAVDGVPDDRAKDFYLRRSRHGLTCCIVGNVVIPGGYGTNSACAWISDRAEWVDLASAIESQGTLPGIQLSSTWSGYEGMRKFALPAALRSMKPYIEAAASFTRNHIDALFDGLADGTELALKAGFKHIQLHAAHGYAFNIALDPRLSSHAEYAYGKARNWAENLKERGIGTSIRFSLYTGDATYDANDKGFVAGLLKLPVSYFDVSAGFYNLNKRLIYPSLAADLERRLRQTVKLAVEHPAKRFVVSGRMAKQDIDALPSNVEIGLCRDLIANPDYLANFDDGCSSCMKCHYFSRREDFLTCGHWANGH